MTAAITLPPLTNWRLTSDDAGLSWLTLDVPDKRVNAISVAVLAELDQVLAYLDSAPPKGLIVDSGKPKQFIVGADIDAFSSLRNAQEARALVQRGWDSFNRLAAARFPTLALIDGPCLGGGLELALACNRRIVVDQPGTVLGLPEVMLGIFPGWGGMRRLPEVIGAPAALDLMLSGRSLDATRAVKAGLADLKVAPRLARVYAAQHVLTSTPPRRQRGLQTLLNRPPLKKWVATRARKSVDARDPHRHYAAPRAIIDIWQHHNGNALAAPTYIDTLLTSPTARNLVRVFHLQERLKAFGKSASGTVAPAHIHVVGAGVMGGDIAAWCALKGMRVTLQDTDGARIAQAQARANALFNKRLRQPLLARDARDRLIPDMAGHGVAQADIVLEAIVENADAKRALYRALEPRMKPDAVLATNTSSLSLSELYPALRLPQRLVGIHFFNPVAKMPLVEIVRTGVSGLSYLQRASLFAGRLGKLPLPVRDTPGFLVNAVLGPYMLEAIQCLDQGMAPESIDAAMVGFGMAMGPIELADKVGLDVLMAAGAALTGGAAAPAALSRVVDQGHLGEKTGRGFYVWKDGRPQKNGTGRSDPGLAERLLRPLHAQAQKQLDLGVVEDADLVDAAMIFGAGYAPFTGGPLHRQNVLQISETAPYEADKN